MKRRTDLKIFLRVSLYPDLVVDTNYERMPITYSDDFSRVTLTEVEDVPGSDYINANFIDVS